MCCSHRTLWSGCQCLCSSALIVLKPRQFLRYSLRSSCAFEKASNLVSCTRFMRGTKCSTPSGLTSLNSASGAEGVSASLESDFCEAPQTNTKALRPSRPTWNKAASRPVPSELAAGSLQLHAVPACHNDRQRGAHAKIEQPELASAFGCLEDAPRAGLLGAVRRNASP
jgi:hypothetical protein